MLLGVDMGSSSCKAAVFSEDGVLYASDSEEYSCAGLKDGQVEIPAEAFYSAFKNTVKRVCERCGDQIRALAISSHGETVIPVGEDGLAVHPALMNADHRGETISADLERKIGKEKLYRITGLPAHPMYSLPKILFFETSYPEEAKKAVRYCTVPDYLHLQMGIEARTDETLASRFMAYDIRKKEWSKEILAGSGFPEEKLCKVVPSGTFLGELPKKTAERMGLSPGTPVFAGGHDQACGVLGSGLPGGGMALSAGTYECLCAISERPLLPEEGLSAGFNSYCHAISGHYITLAFFPAAAVLDWYLTLLCGRGEDKYKVLDGFETNPGGPTGILLTPHLLGACNPHWNPDAKGAIYGLTMQSTPSDLAKAVLEGISCELRMNRELLTRYFGAPTELRAFGGNIRRNFSAQLRADITGTQILRLGAGETVCRGAAILAGTGAGIFKDQEEAAKRMSGESRRFVPNPEVHLQYEEQYRKYCGLYSAMQEL